MKDSDLSPDKPSFKGQVNPPAFSGTASTPSAAPLGLLSALCAGALLALGLAVVGETAEVSRRAWVFLIPPLVALGFVGGHLQRVYRSGQGAVSLRRVLRGVGGICLLTAFFSALVLVLWYRVGFPDIMEARLAEAARQMAEDGYSPGDVDEHLRRSRQILYGPLAVVLGGILWSVAGLLPSSLLLLLMRR
jgi:hypothetical protein